MIRLSIIIITRNREQMLEACLNNLYREVSPDTEVIIIDNSDRPSGGHLGKFIGLRYIYDPSCKGNLPKARNRGIKEARGEIIAFIDDDIFVASGWREAMSNGFSEDRIAAVGGPILGPGEELEDYDGSYIFGRIFVKKRKMNVSLKEPIKVECICGGNMAFRQKALQEIGGFDENYIETGWSEDGDICARIIRAGYDIIYSSKAIVRHKAAPRVDSPLDNFYSYRFQYIVGRNYSYFALKNYLRSYYGLSKVYIEDTFYYLFLSLQRLSPKLFLAFLCNVLGKIAGIGVYVKKISR